MCAFREPRGLSRRSTAYSDADSRNFSRRSTFEAYGDQAGPDYHASRASKRDLGTLDAGDSRKLAALSSWKSEVDQLTHDQLHLFQRSSETEDFHDYTRTLQHAIKNRTDNSKIFGFVKKVRPIYDLVKNFAPVAGAGSELSPVPFSAILGGITSILSISARVDDYQAKIVDMLASMASELRVLDKYKKASLFEDDPEVQASQIEVTTDILKFCVTAAKIFFNGRGKERSGLLIVLKAQWKDFEAKFGDIKTQFQQHLSELEKWRSLGSRQQIRSIGRDVDDFRGAFEQDRSERKQAANNRREAEMKQAIETNRRRVTTWLPTISFSRIQDDNYERRVEGTGDWLVEHPDFLEWEESSGPAALWVHGKPGSGKSHLAARVIHDLNRKEGDTPLAYVYCSSTQLADKLNLNNIFGSLLAQLYVRLSPEHDVKSLVTRANSMGNESASRSEMKGWILEVIAKLRSCFIVIDALDECSFFERNQFADLCNFVSSLPRQSEPQASTKVIIFSRPNYNIIERALSWFPQIQIDNGANANDIEVYISEMFDDIEPDPLDDQISGLNDIKNMMLGHADGMFLWVQLKIRVFEQIGTVEGIMEDLENSTEGLDDLYQQAFRKILAQPAVVRDRALKALLWVVNAYTSLSKAELLEALSVKPGSRGITNNSKHFRSLSICTECADLLVEMNGKYQLLHASLRDFVIGQQHTIPVYTDLQRNAHEILAETCLTYLTFEKLRCAFVQQSDDLVNLMEQHPLLEYASLYWGDHFSAAEGLRNDRLHLLLVTFLEAPLALDTSIKVLESKEFIRGIFQYPGQPSALHVLSILNLWAIAEAYPRFKRSINEHDSLNYLPIDYAVIHGSREMTEWLLGVYATEEASFSTCLDCCQVNLVAQAISMGWDDTVADLVEMRVEKNELPEPNPRMSAIYEAVDANSLAVLEMMLKKGINPNTRSDLGVTPLILATQRKSVIATEMLLKAGAETNARGEAGLTALHHAAENGHGEIVSLLLSHGAHVDVNADDEELWDTPLCRAVWKDHIEAAEILLDAGASIHHTGSDGFNPLLISIRYNHLDMMKMLIRRGADIKSVPHHSGGNALHMAAREGHPRVVEALLELCKDYAFVDQKNNLGHTPISTALNDRPDPRVTRALLENGAESDFQECVPFLPDNYFHELHRLYKLLVSEEGPKSTTLEATLDTLASRGLHHGIPHRKFANTSEGLNMRSPGEEANASPQGIGQMMLATLRLVQTSLSQVDLEDDYVELLAATMWKCDTVWISSVNILRYLDSYESDIMAESEYRDVEALFANIKNSLSHVTSESDYDNQLDVAEAAEPRNATPRDQISRCSGGDEEDADHGPTAGARPADTESRADTCEGFQTPGSDVVEFFDATRGKNIYHPTPSGESGTTTNWTEIGKHLIARSAVTMLEYLPFVETESFFYIMDYLVYEQVYELVILSDGLKAGRIREFKRLHIGKAHGRRRCHSSKRARTLRYGPTEAVTEVTTSRTTTTTISIPRA